MLTNGSSFGAISQQPADPTVHRPGVLSEWRPKSTPPPPAAETQRPLRDTLRNFAAAPSVPGDRLTPAHGDSIDSMLDELKQDPAVDDAIATLDSNPPPSPFVRTRTPVEGIDSAVARGQVSISKIPKPARLPGGYGPPKAEQDDSITPPGNSQTRLIWPLIGVAVVLFAFISQTMLAPAEQTEPEFTVKTVTEPAAVAVAKPQPAPEPVAVPEPKPEPGPPASLVNEQEYERELKLAERSRGRKAEAAYRRALERNPRGSAAKAGLAMQLLGRGKTKEAARLAKEAAELDPTSSLAWITLGAARQELRDRPGAREAFRNCVDQGKGRYVAECRSLTR